MGKRIGLYVLFLCVFLSGYAQTPIRRQVTTVHPVDSVDLQYYGKKQFWGAAGQTLGINALIFSFNRFVTKEEFAYVTMHSIRDNLKKGFVWDNDMMSTNMFGHPYHGSLYFNSGRSRGYNYWESGLFALGGSLTWELFGENEYPSVNDLIVTPIGGMALGEVLYRSSDMILDDRARGRERTWREISAFVVDPMRGLTRLMNGDMKRKRATSGRQFGIPYISLEVSAGMRALELRDEILDDGVGAALEVNIEYGDKFDDECKRPFDYFSLRGDFNFQKHQPLIGQLNVTGRLWVTDLVDNSKDLLTVGFYQHFDYYDSDTISSVSNQIPYKLSAPASAGIGFIHKSKRFQNWTLDSYAHANAVILGATLSDHYRVDNRDYNLGSGFSIQTGANITYKDIFSASVNYELYRIFTWKGYPEDIDWDNVDPHEFDYQGDHSQASFQVINLRSQLKFWQQMYLTGSYSFFVRDTNYRYFRDIRSRTHEGKIMLTYKF